TADWCMNCKLLESTVLHTVPILDLVDQKGIVTMTADWTNQNDQSNEMKAINQLLDQFGGRQVPVIMIFDPRNPEQPEILRGLFTTSELVNKLDKLPSRDNNKK
ncbi:MAG: thioredoxin family protein, partial [Planctomycetia bacterium]|nr:thioredoxin family protein [Planctomycetia bacterium]